MPWEKTLLLPLATPAAGLFLEGCKRAVTLPCTLTLPCLLLCFAKSWNCFQSPSQGLWAKQWLRCEELLVWPFWSQESPGKASITQRGSLLSAGGKDWSRSPRLLAVSLVISASFSLFLSIGPFLLPDLPSQPKSLLLPPKALLLPLHCPVTSSSSHSMENKTKQNNLVSQEDIFEDVAVQKPFPVFLCCWYWGTSPLRHICLAGNWCLVLEIKEILRVFRQICNICVMLPVLGHTDWEAAEVLCVCSMHGRKICFVIVVQQKSQPKEELPGLTGGGERVSTELEEEPAFSSLYPSSP